MSRHFGCSGIAPFFTTVGLFRRAFGKKTVGVKSYLLLVSLLFIFHSDEEIGLKIKKKNRQ